MSRYVEYILVNKDLDMSVGKIAGQVAHVQTMIDYECFYGDLDEFDNYEEWLENGQKKVILRAKESKLQQAIKLGGIPVRDHGLTEIPENSLTVVGFLPCLEKDNEESELRKFVKRLQLL